MSIVEVFYYSMLEYVELWTQKVFGRFFQHKLDAKTAKKPWISLSTVPGVELWTRHSTGEGHRLRRSERKWRWR